MRHKIWHENIILYMLNQDSKLFLGEPVSGVFNFSSVETMNAKFDSNDFITEEQWPTNFIDLNIFDFKKMVRYIFLSNSMEGFFPY